MATLEGVLLECVFVNVVLTRDAVTSITNPSTGEPYQHRYFWETLDGLLKSGYLRSFTEVETYGRQKKTLEYITITIKGIKYLVETAREDKANLEEGNRSRIKTSLPWLPYVNLDKVNNTLASTSDIFVTKDKMYRISEAALMASMIGAGTQNAVHLFRYDRCKDLLVNTPDVIDDDIVELTEYGYTAHQAIKSKINKEHVRSKVSKSKSYQQLILDAIEQWSVKETDAFLAFFEELRTRDLRFVHPSAVKAVLVMTAVKKESELSAQDISRARFDGLLQSTKRTLLLYGCHTPNMVWPHDIAYIERSILDKWCVALNPEYKAGWDQKHYGAVLIQNPRAFKTIYQDTGNVRKRKYSLGDCFESLYVLPVTVDGECDLGDIMTQTWEEHLKSASRTIFRRDFDKNETFDLNTEYHPELLQYKSINREDESVCYYALGTWMDIRQMQQLEKVLEEQKNAEGEARVQLGVICYPWQKDYYKYVNDGLKICASDKLMDTYVDPAAEKTLIGQLNEYSARFGESYKLVGSRTEDEIIQDIEKCLETNTPQRTA